VVPLYRLPLVARTGGDRIICDNARLPFATRSFHHAVCANAFEYVIDDQQLMTEIARILAPGARVEVAVPHRHGLGRLDGLNAYRYLRDATGRGAPVQLLTEIGWRRHYDIDELESMMTKAGFSEVNVRTVGLGLHEIGALAAALNGGEPATRAQDSSANRWPAAGSIRIPANLGAQLVVTAIRSR
jgi:SAM-dependent methyltransferase